MTRQIYESGEKIISANAFLCVGQWSTYAFIWLE